MDKLTNWLSDEITYGFGSLTQDEFCTIILTMLGIITACTILKYIITPIVKQAIKIIKEIDKI